MARIESVIVHRRSVPLVRPFVTSVRRADTVDALLVEVRDADGRSGWGEAPTSWRVTGESHESVASAVAGPLTASTVGMPSDDPREASARLARAVVGNPSARMGVECAIWDLAARTAGLPLHRYLGGRADRIESDMTLSAAVTADDAEDLIRTALEHVGNGFTTLKVKTGAGGDDDAIVRRVRAAVGDAIAIRVDANQGWTPDEAVRIVNGWRDDAVGVELVEQPVHRDDIAGLAYVSERTTTPVVADESVWNARQLREVLVSRAVSRINIKLAKTGGIAEALALAELARQRDVSVFVGCMSESHVGIASAAAVASALAETGGLHGAQDLDAGLWLASSPVEGGVSYRGPWIRLSDAPGTGISSLATIAAEPGTAARIPPAARR
ncbi:mandelate racemase/muconate lactonizing enzyme family protein [Leifsonia soli]|uniref:Dipeptide epimerase n=1 Tax=Leifsonia soli TaxID=582665 RepID=A0A852T0L3_9MICO|nr:dipeptide epimerase [Leifsonia soli]NYD74979.1 o-succinylbenzoate synthase [Leifsonia soli]